MPILLKIQVERTAKTQVAARRARVGGLCGFRSTAERRTHPAAENRTLCRCAGALQKRQARKKIACGRFSAEGEAASGEAGQSHGVVRAPAAVTSARRAGSFGALRGRSKSSEKQPRGVAE